MATINLVKLTEQVMLHNAFENSSKSQVQDLLRFIFATIIENTAKGDDTTIPGVGKFYKFTSSTTGKHRPKFRPAKAFVEAVAN